MTFSDFQLSGIPTKMHFYLRCEDRLPYASLTQIDYTLERLSSGDNSQDLNIQCADGETYMKWTETRECFDLYGLQEHVFGKSVNLFLYEVNNKKIKFSSHFLQ